MVQFSVPPKSINRGAIPGYDQSASSRATVNISSVAQQPGPARQLRSSGLTLPCCWVSDTYASPYWRTTTLLPLLSRLFVPLPMVPPSNLGFLSTRWRLSILLPSPKARFSLPCVEASGFWTIHLATTTLWLWIGALIVRYTLDAVCGTNPFDDPIGAYGENPEWERSSRILLLSGA